MGLTHLTFYRDNDYNSTTLAETLNISYFQANKMIRGLKFMSIDEYKKLVKDPDMKIYLEMKRDFELQCHHREKIDDTGSIIVYFYPKYYHVTAINNSYDIIWTAPCKTKEAATRLWNEYQSNNKS